MTGPRDVGAQIDEALTLVNSLLTEAEASPVTCVLLGVAAAVRYPRWAARWIQVLDAQAALDGAELAVSNEEMAQMLVDALSLGEEPDPPGEEYPGSRRPA